MDSSIFAILFVDGVTNGIIYGLIAIALVLVFAITRILFIPQGEFVTYSALSLAMLQEGMIPGPVWMLLFLSVSATGMDLFDHYRRGQMSGALSSVVQNLFIPCIVAFLVIWAAPMQLAFGYQIILTLLLITCMGPLTYKVIYESLQDASVLLLLIVSVGVHLAMTGLGLVFFGAEGFRLPPVWEERWILSFMTLSGQTVVVIVAAIALMIGLWLFSEKTIYGKALRATAINRIGAQLMSISTNLAGRLSFMMAAFIAGLSGVLIGSMSTIFYDSGFMIGLKGFVAATIGGLGSFPLAGISALAVGLLESFSSFWASDFKEVIVFISLLPVLLWRSFTTVHQDDEE